MVHGEVPDCITGIWIRQRHLQRFAQLAERILLKEPLQGGGEPQLIARQWAVSASTANHHMVADLRLDNAAELRATLGEPAANATPEELALLAWEKWGEDGLARLEGDFALAIWDRRGRRLILARDALGQRPLHFRTSADATVFASTPGRIAQLYGEPEPDLERLASFLSLVPDPAPSSFVKGVERVVPGHFAVIDRNGGARQLRWWRPSLQPARIAFDEAVEAMRTEVDRAVAAALIAPTRPVAAQLSGGLDSSLVLETASRLVGHPSELIAITGAGVGATPDILPTSFDEAEVAAETAAMLGVPHAHATAQPESPLAAVDRWLTAASPVLNPYNLGWLDAVYAEGRSRGATVMLAADSGNLSTSWGGMDRLALLTQRLRWLTLAREFMALHRRRGASLRWMAAKSFGHLVPAPVWKRLVALRGYSTAERPETVYLRARNEHVRRARRVAREVGAPISSRPSQLLGSKARFLELEWGDPGLPNHHVRARYGIELRDPLGARRVVELSLRLGPEHFFHDGRGRRLARAMLAGRVPARVVEEQRLGRQGANWLASGTLALQEMIHEVETIAGDPELGALIDTGRLRERLRHWPAAASLSPEETEIYQYDVTGTIAAARWARRMRETS